MVAFWILAALLALIALVFVLRPLLGSSDLAFSAEARGIRNRMVSLDRALADGHIDHEAHATKRAELKAQMESLLDRPRPESRATGSAAALAVLLPVGAILIYLAVGEPRGVELAGPTGPSSAASLDRGPATGGDQGTQAAPDLRQAIEGLAARLEANPDDVDGWFLLGQSYMSVSDFASAEQAFAEAYRLAPDNPAILEMYGNAIAFNSVEGALPDEARALFEKALSLNPDSQRSLYFLGAGAFQLGDYEGALDYWERLHAGLDQAGEAARRLREDINAARAELGRDPLEVADEADTSSPADTTAAAEPSSDTQASGSPPTEAAGLTVEVALADALREQVAPSDTLFIFARAAEGPRMPLAIQRLPAGSLPVTVRLDESMAMSPAMNISTFPQIVVEARISKSGDASPQPGDLQALSDPVENDQQEPVRLIIDRVL